LVIIFTYVRVGKEQTIFWMTKFNLVRKSDSYRWNRHAKETRNFLTSIKLYSRAYKEYCERHDLCFVTGTVRWSLVFSGTWCNSRNFSSVNRKALWMPARRKLE